MMPSHYTCSIAQTIVTCGDITSFTCGAMMHNEHNGSLESDMPRYYSKPPFHSTDRPKLTDGESQPSSSNF